MEGAEHACARPQLAKNFAAKGMFLTYNMGDVDAACEEFTKAGYPLAMPLKTETWFERHCYVIDPNGIPLNLAHWNATPAEPKGSPVANLPEYHLAKRDFLPSLGQVYTCFLQIANEIIHSGKRANARKVYSNLSIQKSSKEKEAKETGPQVARAILGGPDLLL